MKHPARTVIITGASAGVGRAIAERFAREGDRVGLIARDETALKDVQRELQASGASALEWEAADVSNAAAVFAAADQLERRLGYVDIWINDAMETVFSTVADINPAEFRRVTEVTYLSFVYGTMAALKSMRPRRRGRIIQIGSGPRWPIAAFPYRRPIAALSTQSVALRIRCARNCSTRSPASQ